MSLFFNSPIAARAVLIQHADPLSRDLPADIDPSITQPTAPVVVFCWVVSQTGGNKVFRCKLCDSQFTGSPILAMTHFDAKLSNQNLKQCRANHPALLKEQIKLVLAEKQVV